MTCSDSGAHVPCCRYTLRPGQGGGCGSVPVDGSARRLVMAALLLGLHELAATSKEHAVSCDRLRLSV